MLLEFVGTNQWCYHYNVILNFFPTYRGKSFSLTWRRINRYICRGIFGMVGVQTWLVATIDYLACVYCSLSEVGIYRALVVYFKIMNIILIQREQKHIALGSAVESLKLKLQIFLSLNLSQFHSDCSFHINSSTATKNTWSNTCHCNNFSTLRNLKPL